MPEINSIYEVSDLLGMDLENKIREKILSNVPPPNAQSTIDRKGSSATLIDNGIMLGSVSHVVEDSGDLTQIKTGILDEGDVAMYASANEYGVQRVIQTKNKDNIDEMHQGMTFFIIPERSFIRSTFDECFDSELMEKFSDNLQDLAEIKLRK